MSRLTAILLACLVLGSCLSRNKGSLLKEEPQKLSWEQHYLRQKAARVLLNNAPFDYLSFRGTDDAYVDHLMNHAKFLETTKLFNEFFLGLYEQSDVDEDFYGYEHAMRSAKQVLYDGDYWMLLDDSLPYQVDSSSADPDHEEYLNIKQEAFDKLSYEEKRKIFVSFFLAEKKVFEARLRAAKPEERCQLLNDDDRVGDRLLDSLNDLGPGFYSFGSDGPFFGWQLECVASPFISDKRLEFLLARFTKQANILIEVSKKVPSINADDPKTHIVLPSVRMKHLSVFFYAENTNSSTNMNRSRAATILKTYFCDDLTPLDLAFEGQSHGQNRHASDPACLACHYKLDPMAGFFRNKGVFGTDFGQFPEGRLLNAQGDRAYHTFDDRRSLNKTEHENFQSQWKNNRGEGLWPVAYVRSKDDPSINSYAANQERPLASLFKIIQQAPEVKRCLVQRAADFFIGKNQSYDEAWLGQLTAKFSQGIEKNRKHSARAYKALVKELILSNGFKERKPIAGKCYDEIKKGKKDKKDKGDVPCEIRAVVKNHCLSCHNSEVTKDGIDLRSYTLGPDGQMSFPHYKNGERLSSKASFKDMLARLSSKDPEFLMPYNQGMPDAARVRLYKWLEGKFND